MGKAMRSLMAGLAIGVFSTIFVSPVGAAEDISALLKRQTQALMDAITYGKPEVWRTLLDDKLIMVDETGAVSDKKSAVDQVQPLPKGISGNITVTEWHANIDGNVAVATFVDDEHENYHGQKLHALYRNTATWIKRPSGWKLLSLQVLATRQDPPAVALPAKLTDEYVGHYSAAPDVSYDITKVSGKLMGAANGGKPVELKAELADVLFTPGQPRSRRIFTRDAAGHITGFLSRREERDIVFTRTK
jgi:hypothetical protein